MFLLIFWITFGVSVGGSSAEEEINCGHYVRAEDEEGNSDPVKRRFAPSRYIDVLHLKLDVTPNFRGRTVSGTATLTFKPIALPLKSLRLDQVPIALIDPKSSVHPSETVAPASV